MASHLPLDYSDRPEQPQDRARGHTVLITPDPAHPGWWIAHGHGLLEATSRIATVERSKEGIAYHDQAADEVRAALQAAGHQLVDGQPRSRPTTPQPNHDSTRCRGCGTRKRRTGHQFCAKCAAGEPGAAWERIHAEDPRYHPAPDAWPNTQ